MNFKLISFKINFLKNIGEMSEKKEEMITKKLISNFPIKQPIPGGIVYNKSINSTTNKSLFVLQNQVTYSIEGDNVETNFHEAKNFAKKVFDILYLDYKCLGICNYTALIEDNGVFENFRNKLDINLDGNETSAIQGVGIKLFIDNTEYTGNFVFEPLIRDTRFIFCSLDLQFKNISGVNNIVVESEKVIKEFLGRLINESYYKIKKIGDI